MGLLHDDEVVHRRSRVVVHALDEEVVDQILEGVVVDARRDGEEVGDDVVSCGEVVEDICRSEALDAGSEVSSNEADQYDCHVYGFHVSVRGKCGSFHLWEGGSVGSVVS